MEGTTKQQLSCLTSKPFFNCYHRGIVALRLSQANASHGCLLADRVRGLPLADDRLNQKHRVQGDQLIANEAVPTNASKGKRSIEAIRKKRLQKNKKKKESFRKMSRQKKRKVHDSLYQAVQNLTAEVTKLNEEQKQEKKLTAVYWNKYKTEEKKKLKLYRYPQLIIFLNK